MLCNTFLASLVADEKLQFEHPVLNATMIGDHMFSDRSIARKGNMHSREETSIVHADHGTWSVVSDLSCSSPAGSKYPTTYGPICNGFVNARVCG